MFLYEFHDLLPVRNTIFVTRLFSHFVTSYEVGKKQCYKIDIESFSL